MNDFEILIDRLWENLKIANGSRPDAVRTVMVDKDTLKKALHLTKNEFKIEHK